MVEKEPVLLVVLIEAKSRRWWVGGIGMDGTVEPLIRSNEGDLSGYEGLEFDGQVAYLRHRFAGVLQIGCDRLRARRQRPCQFAFVCDDWFCDAAPELTRRVAEHFAEWMANPPVVFYRYGNAANGDGSRELDLLAGTIGDAERDVLAAGLKELRKAADDGEGWEVIERS